MSIWVDLQEAFYIVLGDFITRLLLPVFIGAGMLLSILMAMEKFWRPPVKAEIVSREFE